MHAPEGTVRDAEYLKPSTDLRARTRDYAVAFLLFLANRIVAHTPSHRLRRAFYRHVLGWKLEPGVTINMGLRLYGGRGKVSIGRNSAIQLDCFIVGAGMVDFTIGNNVAIAYRTMFILGGHSPASPKFEAVTGPIILEDYVFIGASSLIMCGITLHEGAVVAAGSVVTKDVAPYTIVAGNPAKPIGERRRDLDYTTETYWFLH